MKTFTLAGQEFSVPEHPGAGYIDRIVQARRKTYREFMRDNPEDAERLREAVKAFLREIFPRWLERKLVDEKTYDLFMSKPEQSAMFEPRLFDAWYAEHCREYDVRLPFLKILLRPVKSSSVEQCYLNAEQGEVEAIEDFFEQSISPKKAEPPRSENNGVDSSTAQAAAESASSNTSPKNTGEITAASNPQEAIPA